MNKHALFEGRNKILLFLCGPRMEIKSLHSETIGTTRTKRNSVEISSINVRSPICFHLNRLGNGNDDILHFENSKKPGVVLIYYYRTDYFCPNILNSRDPVL
jgi:hypothetical protein